MSRARCYVAAKAPVDKVREAATRALCVATDGDAEACVDWDAVLDFVQPNCDLYGAEAGSDAWYLFKHGEWTVLGDLTMNLGKNTDHLATLSAALGTPLVVAAIDAAFEYACFATFEDGEMVRRLVLDEDQIEVDGRPVKAELGRRLDDFNEEECERLWTSYGLPTFEVDPHESSPFQCIAVRRSD